MTVELWVTIIVGLAGIFIGIFVTWFFTARMKIRYKMNTTIVISSKTGHEKIGITYDGGKVDRLSHTLVNFKNTGNHEVLKKRITGNGIEISFDDQTRIYEAGLQDISQEETAVRLSRNKNNGLLVMFDFLEKTDSFSVNILHDSENNPKVSGKIISCRLFEDDNGNRFLTTVVVLFWVLFGIFSIGYIIYMIPEVKSNTNTLYSIGFFSLIPISIVWAFLKSFIDYRRNMRTEREKRHDEN